jgi:sigma-B regulation protein RsbU (phosphoserine phosphatase)
MARIFERKLFDLIENISRAQREGSFVRALSEGLFREFGTELGLVAAAEFHPEGSRYEMVFSFGAPLWSLIDYSLPVRSVQRRLADQLWWIQRGLKQETAQGTQWYDLLLIPIGHDLNHIMGLLTRSLSGEEGQDREAQFHVLGQLIRLFVDRHHQRERLQEILTLARDQQLSLLQSELPPLSGYQVAGLSIPAEEVGGDYYQVIPLNRKSFAATLGDAKGKGFEAAVLVTALHAALRVVNEIPFKVAHKVALLNRSLAEKEIRNLVTLFYGEFEEEGRIIYVNCSHPPALVVRKDTIEDLQVGGVFLGLDYKTEYRIGVCELNPGDLVVMYTDGWSELFNEQNEELGPEGLREIVRDCHGMNPREVLERIQRACDEFRGVMPYHDDRTLLVVRKD